MELKSLSLLSAQFIGPVSVTRNLRGFMLTITSRLILFGIDGGLIEIEAGWTETKFLVPVTKHNWG